MNQPNFRHEYKHVIHPWDYEALRRRLAGVARLDPHAGADGRYHIRSLYFDNPQDKALREKLEGLPNREKFRMRIYHHKGDRIRLEKKSKVGGLCQKQTALLTRDQGERILAGDTAWLPGTGDPLLTEFYSKLRCQQLAPKTLVDYWREAYLYPYGNVRVTFDSDIRTGVYATNLFDQELPTLPAGEPKLLVLEVKYDRFLPDVIRDLIQTNTRHTQAFSKYAACRIYG